MGGENSGEVSPEASAGEYAGLLMLSNFFERSFTHAHFTRSRHTLSPVKSLPYQSLSPCHSQCHCFTLTFSLSPPHFHCHYHFYFSPSRYHSNLHIITLTHTVSLSPSQFQSHLYVITPLHHVNLTFILSISISLSPSHYSSHLHICTLVFAFIFSLSLSNYHSHLHIVTFTMSISPSYFHSQLQIETLTFVVSPCLFCFPIFTLTFTGEFAFTLSVPPSPFPHSFLSLASSTVTPLSHPTSRTDPLTNADVMTAHSFALFRFPRPPAGVASVACPQCPKLFSSSTFLKYHLESSHGESNKRFTCNFCGKKFPQSWKVSLLRLRPV